MGHGFLALEDHTAVAYLVSTPFSPKEEFEINPLDEKVGVTWGVDLSTLKISSKDRTAPSLMDLKSKNLLPALKIKHERA